MRGVPCRLILVLLLASSGVSGGKILAQTAAASPAADSGKGASAPLVTIVVNSTAKDEAQPRPIGGSVSAPILIHSIDPQYSEEARRAKVSGNVLVHVRIDQHGTPTHIEVLRGIGMGLDEKAVEAIKQYRFKPSMEHGEPVVVEFNIEVNFQIKDKAAEPTAYTPPADDSISPAPAPQPTARRANRSPVDPGTAIWSPDATTLVKTTAGGEPEPWQTGGTVTAPVAIHSVEPEYTEEARRKMISGEVQVHLLIDVEGNATQVRVLHGVDAGLDERAVEAIRQYKFKPATEQGKPVAVELTLQVSFHIFRDKAAMDQAADGNSGANSPARRTAAYQTAKVTASGLKTIADQKRYAEDAKFQKAIDELKAPSMLPEERLARWKNANKVAQNQCVACLHAIVRLQMQASQWKDAIVTARQLDAIGPDAKDRFVGESEMATAMLHANNGHPKPDEAQAALASLQSAIALSVGNKALEGLTKNLVYTQGRALALLNRDADASAMFQKYVDMVPYSDSYRARAQHFVDEPQLAAMPMAPPFTLTTSEGEQISLDDMGGKVVLLDFWATWCGPCKVTLPEIQKIAKDFAGQPLVVISISSDSDKVAWQNYIEKNNMTWPQYRDVNGALNRAYEVSGIPSFFTIDTNGVLQSMKVGSGANVTGDIRKLVNKARDAEKKKAKEPGRAAAGG